MVSTQKLYPNLVRLARNRFARIAVIVFIVLNCLLFTARSYHDSISDISADVLRWTDQVLKTRPHATIKEYPPYVERVRQFWKPWEETIVNAKPPFDDVHPSHSYGWVSVPPDGWTQPRPLPDRLIDLSEEQIQSLAAAHKKMRDKLDGPTLDSQDIFFRGRGVVMTAGGKYLPPAVVNVQMLRLSGSKMPVEMWFANEEEYNEQVCSHMHDNFDVRCLLLSDFLKDGPFDNIGGYQLKVMALLFSSFQEVILLDSDNIPVVDPAFLLETDAYKATGFLGWSDFWAGSETPDFYKIAGLDGFPDLPYGNTESGQLVVDKKRHLKTFLLSSYYNIYGPGTYYPLQCQGGIGQGDKTTFTLAATVLGLDWYRVPTPPERLEDAGGPSVSGTVQYEPSPLQQDVVPWRNTVNSSVRDVKPVFFHANSPKLNAGELAHKSQMMIGDRHTRIWSQEWTNRTFHEDIEKTIWDIVVESGCTLQPLIREWQEEGWNDTCTWAKERQKALFLNEP